MRVYEATITGRKVGENVPFYTTKVHAMVSQPAELIRCIHNQYESTVITKMNHYDSLDEAKSMKLDVYL